MHRPLLALLPLALVLLSGNQPAHAGAVELQGFFGYYNAKANALEESTPAGLVVAEHASAPSFGARADFWLNPKVAIEVAGSYTSTDLEGQAFGIAGSTGAQLFFGSARLMVSGAKDPRKARLHAGAGAVYITSSYDDIDGDSWMAITATTGVRMPLSEDVALRVDIDGYWYTLQWEFGDVVTENLTQYDLVLSAGISRYFE